MTRSKVKGRIRAAALADGWPQRLTAALLVSAAIGLLLLGRIEPAAIERLRTPLSDAVTPVLVVLRQPLEALARLSQQFSFWVDVHGDNARLRAQNEQLRQWYHAAARLQAENAELRALLDYVPDPRGFSVTARVVADGGGPFVRSISVAAGAFDGVGKNQAALSGDGLVGRVSEVGRWSARVLLMTDINSRIPVTVEASGDRAMLAGDNSAEPRLIYLPRDAIPNEGARIVTSGHGGLFPPGLPVGTLRIDEAGRWRVRPFADLARLDHVRLQDAGAMRRHWLRLPPLRVLAEPRREPVE